ncbi:dihydropteroate synthase [Spongiivirga citrea]|uniref:Dihydropteroate synthase n=1 Tax=Spongiivirga citrea TaxID=1481457 RepID=A0A6M0CIV6_9FLAO|nr:dihydropteroate synthase [Spongiivirga citrea]NER17886.1 dihydropteroate synthase [Spongiivirga citrea]
MTINCKGTLIDLSLPRVMGILNMTPDSFHDGGAYKNEKEVLAKVESMLEEGATFIDIGGYSSRPGADHVSEDEELKRVLPVVELLIKQFPDILISIDTFRSNVASKCIQAEAAIINDISAGNLDAEMFKVIAAHQVPYIMMHMQGRPKDMQHNPSYDDVIKEMVLFFSEKIKQTRDHKINDLIIDPGFGFGKTIDHNYEILNSLEFFKHLDMPILVGVSRKSMIYKLLDTTPEHALNGTTALHSISLIKGANILRVHDVKEAVECVRLFNTMDKFN